MKIKRNKKAARYMSIYRNNFGFREPYQVLLDGTFCQVALQHKVNIQDQLPKYLNGECKFLTTACVIEETKKLGKPLHGAYTILSQYSTHDCGHEKPLSASKCLSSFVSADRNKSHYLIATQDANLRDKVSRMVICPLLKLANNAPVMDKPTTKVMTKVEKRHNAIANHIRKRDLETLKILEDNAKPVSKDTNLETEETIKRKRKGPRGANPLSCKKPSRKQNDKNDKSQDQNNSKKRIRRHKIKIPRHVRKLLDESNNIGQQVNCV